MKIRNDFNICSSQRIQPQTNRKQAADILVAILLVILIIFFVKRI